MPSEPLNADRIKAIFVPVAMAGTVFFNWVAAMGLINGVTPEMVSNKYPTPLTPAGFGFTIWILIYIGLAAFSTYQLLPQHADRFRPVRTLFIVSCILNCAWLYFWAFGMIGICLVTILALLAVISVIDARLRKNESTVEYWVAKAPFGLYFGWVTVAAAVNIAVFLVYEKFDISPLAMNIAALALMIVVVVIVVAARAKFKNYLAPLAVAWALTAIAIKQSGDTMIVVAAAIGVIACLIASLSVIMDVSTINMKARK
jgi:hypothetical protein